MGNFFSKVVFFPQESEYEVEKIENSYFRPKKIDNEKIHLLKKNLPIFIDFSPILKFSPKTSPKIQNRRKIGQN